MNLNKVMIAGNLTRDPELRYTPKGTAVAELGLAINRVFSDDQGVKKEDATFVDVTLWGRTAEIAQQYLHKGSQVYVEGRLKPNEYTDKNGVKVFKPVLVADNIQFLDARPNEGGDDDMRGSGSSDSFGSRRGASIPAPAPSPEPTYPDEMEPPMSGGGKNPADDIPF